MHNQHFYECRAACQLKVTDATLDSEVEDYPA